MKVRFTKIIDRYEKEIKSLVTDKYKESYIGQIGVVLDQNIYPGKNNLFVVKFDDGQVWCLEKEQFEVISIEDYEWTR